MLLCDFLNNCEMYKTRLGSFLTTNINLGLSLNVGRVNINLATTSIKNTFIPSINTEAFKVNGQSYNLILAGGIPYSPSRGGLLNKIPDADRYIIYNTLEKTIIEEHKENDVSIIEITNDIPLYTEHIFTPQPLKLLNFLAGGAGGAGGIYAWGKHGQGGGSGAKCYGCLKLTETSVENPIIIYIGKGGNINTSNVHGEDGAPTVITFNEASLILGGGRGGRTGSGRYNYGGLGGEITRIRPQSPFLYIYKHLPGNSVEQESVGGALLGGQQREMDAHDFLDYCPPNQLRIYDEIIPAYFNSTAGGNGGTSQNDLPQVGYDGGVRLFY